MEEFKLNIDLTKYRLNVTFFPRTLGSDTKGMKVSIEEIIRRSSTFEYHQAVIKLRTVSDETVRKRYKYRFPCITPHAIVVGGAEKENITEGTNLLLCDWDFESSQIAREKFPIIAEVLGKHLIFNRYSISGTGVHSLLLIDDPINRLAYIEKIDARFREFGFQQDPMLRNIVQKGIITSGDGQILNPHPIPFEGTFDGVVALSVEKKSIAQRVSGAAQKKKKGEIPAVRLTVEYLHKNYTVVRDSLTGNITVNGQLLSDNTISTMVMDALLHGFMANKELVTAWVKSDFVKVENRFEEFRRKYQHLSPSGVIKRLAACLIVDSLPANYPNFVEDSLRLWLVKLVAQLYEPKPNDIAIFVIGPQNIGKTWFFAHLLPDELSDLYAEISFKNDREYKVACTRYVIITDDELKSRITDVDFVKSLLSSPFVNVRKLYDVLDYNYRRIASFCGTSNDPQLLNDPSGNRRFICLLLKNVDRDGYTAINKAELFMEVYNLYRSDFDLRPSKELLAAIQENSKQFEVLSLAEEVLIEYFPPADPDKDNSSDWFWWPVNHLVGQINLSSKVRIKEYHVGVALKKLKYHSKYAKVGKSKLRVYAIRPTQGTEWGQIDDGSMNTLPPLGPSPW